MSEYIDFARFYDRLMYDCDYDRRADYLLSLFDRFACKPKLMLDLACGTGNFTYRMAQRGVDVIGVDMSADMLGIAGEKADIYNVSPLFLCQRADELDLYGTIDSCICTLDSVNHITDYDELCRAFDKVSLFMEKGGLFIFDVNTEYKHEVVLGDNTFVTDDGELYTVWSNENDGKFVNITLDFFLRKGDIYERYSEEFSERAYTDEELENALKNAGFETVAVYGDMTFDAPEPDEERKIFIARKI